LKSTHDITPHPISPIKQYEQQFCLIYYVDLPA